MNSNKITLAAIFTLLILLGGRFTAAQAQDWSQATSAAVAASQRGDYALAEASIRKPSRFSRQTLGADNPGIAISLNNLAVFYQDQSKYPQAEQTYLQALAILEKDPRQKASTGLTLNNLAALYHDEGMDAKAEPLYKHALGIWENLGKIRTPIEAVYSDWPGRHLSLPESGFRAEPLYLRALTLWNEAGKTESAGCGRRFVPSWARFITPEATIRTPNRCMPTRWRSGKTLHKWRARKRLTRRAPSEKFTGPRGNTGSRTSAGTGSEGLGTNAWDRIISDLAASLNNLALLYYCEAKYDAAEPLYKRALEIREKNLGTDDPAVQQTQQFYAALLRQVGRKAEAQKLEAQASGGGVARL